MHKHATGFPDVINVPVVLDNEDLPDADIADGDLLFDDGNGFASPVTEFTWDTNLATTQAAFVAAFLGVSSGRSRLGSEDARDLVVPVRMDGNDQVDCVSAAHQIGDLLGPYHNVGNDGIINTLATVATRALATHICMETTDGAVTTVRARIINSVPKR